MGAGASLSPLLPLSQALQAISGSTLDDNLPFLCSLCPPSSPCIPLKLLLSLKAGTLLYDKTFPRTLTNTRYDANPDVFWKSLADLPLFPPNDDYLPNHEMVVQGSHPDCFLVASLSLLRHYQLTKIIKPLDNGMYLITLHVGPCEQAIEVDSFVPFMKVYNESRDDNKQNNKQEGVLSAYDGVPIFASSTRASSISSLTNSSCFSLIEKAFAKLHGNSYANLDGGNVAETLFNLLGCAVEDLHLKDNKGKQAYSNATLKSLVLDNLIAGNLMSTGFVDSLSDNSGDFKRIDYGLRKNHAYAVVYAREGGVQIYNPQGVRDDFNGGIHEDGGSGGSEDRGTLTLSWNQFHKAFNRLQIAYVCSDEELPEVTTIDNKWTKGSAGGCTSQITFRDNEVLMLPVGEGGDEDEWEVILGQDDKRTMKTCEGEVSYDEIGITVVKLDDKLPSSSEHAYSCLTSENYRVVAKTKAFSNKRETVLKFTKADLNLEGENPTHLGVVFSKYEAGLIGDYWVRVRSKNRNAEPPKFVNKKDAASCATSVWSGSSTNNTKHLLVKGVEGKSSFSVAVFLKNKKGGTHPLGCWVIGYTDGNEEFEVLLKPTFVKCKERSILWVNSENNKYNKLVIVPSTFKSGVTLKLEVEAQVLSFEGQVLLIEEEGFDVGLKVKERERVREEATTSSEVLLSKKKGAGGKGGGGGGKKRKPNFQIAKKSVEGLGNMYKDLGI